MRFRHTALFLVFVGLILCGCTDPVSLEPTVTDATWVPTLNLQHNNYHRVQVEFADPPLAVDRNLTHLLVQYRPVGAAEYTALDTIDVRSDRYLSLAYRTRPIFEEGQGYALRMKTQHRKGGEKISNVVRFDSPVVQGSILDSIALQPTPNCIGCVPKDFQITEDYIYLWRSDSGGDLVRVDRTTEEREDLNSMIPSDLEEDIDKEAGMAVSQDTLIFGDYSDKPEKLFSLIKIDVQTGEYEKSVSLPVPPDTERGGRIVHYDGNTIHLVWDLGEKQQIQVFDARTGAAIKSYSEYTAHPNESSGVFDLFEGNDIVYDGSQYWISISKDFDNRIARFDPNTGNLGPHHRNPVFYGSGLTWDGEQFWVYGENGSAFLREDREENVAGAALFRIQLNGL